MAAVLLIAAALKFLGDGGGNGEVEAFRGAKLKKEVWNPLIAASVNEKPLSLLVDEIYIHRLF